VNAARAPRVEPDSAPADATRVGRNTAFRAAAQAASAVINVAGMVLLGNHLSASGYGEYAYFYAWIPLLAGISDLGAGVIVTREMARDREHASRMLGDGLILRAAVGLVLLLGGAMGASLDPAHAVLVLLVTAAAVLEFGQDPAVWAFRARERLDLESVLLLVSQFAWLAGIAASVWLGASLPVLLGVAAASFLLRTIVGAVMLARMGLAPRFEFASGRLRALAAEGWPVGLSLLLVVVYGRVGVFALKHWSTAADVACFNVAYMLSQPFGFLASALSMAAFPAFARLRGGDPRELARPQRGAVKYQLVVAMPIAAGLLLVADQIVPLLFKDAAGYDAAVSALRVTALALPCVFLNLHARYVLAALGRQRGYLAAVVLGLVANTIGCALTTRTFGALGAAWTFVAAEALVLFACQRALPAGLGAGALLGQAWRPLAAVLLMVFAVFAVRGAGLLAEIAVGAMAYAAGLLLTRALSHEDWALLRRVFASFRLAGATAVAEGARRA